MFGSFYLLATKSPQLLIIMPQLPGHYIFSISGPDSYHLDTLDLLLSVSVIKNSIAWERSASNVLNIIYNDDR